MSYKIFISYSHDSVEHRDKVLSLAERLRADGIETLLDQYVNGSPEQGWSRWMLDQLDAADWVLVICSETYYRRFRGHEVPGKGKGVDWEGALITQELYDRRSRTLKFVPVLLSGATPSCIPEPLRAVTYYSLTSDWAYQSLYDFLLNQAGVGPAPVGSLKTKLHRSGIPLTFGATAAAIGFQADLSRIVKYAPAELIGREDELRLLSDAWEKTVRAEKGRPHILTIVALGGEGKTSLVAKWVAELAHQDWPGCDDAFAWSFYSQGTREQSAASSDLFLKEALDFFGDDADRQFAASSAGAHEKGQRLSRLVGQRRSLIILDGLEPLQFAPTAPSPGELKDQGLAALLKGLAAASRGLCIVTTRYSLPDLKAFWQTTAPEVPLMRLSRAAGVHLLNTLGVRGTAKESDKLVEDVKGHALTLTLLGGFLKRAFHGDIRQRDRVRFEKADEKMDGGHAFRTMAAYEQWLLRDGGDEGRREVAVLRLMGLFDRPADASCIAVLRNEAIPGLTEPLAGLPDDDWEYCLSGLEASKLLTVNRGASGELVSLDAHPHLREYFARHLRMHHHSVWRTAHRRLFEHLCATTKESGQPTLEELAPLYQALSHGCAAELEEIALEVFIKRIQQGNAHYSTRKLGAFATEISTLVLFFDELWRVPSARLSTAGKMHVLNQAGLILKVQVRLHEAQAALEAGKELAKAHNDFLHAAEASANLNRLHMLQGHLREAESEAVDCVEFGKQAGNDFELVGKLTLLADTLHYAGKHSESLREFKSAERLSIEQLATVLRGTRCFRFCDLLLTLGQCETVINRVNRWLESKEQQGELIDIALGHLALGMALFEISQHENSDSREAETQLRLALDKLRATHRTDYLPRGLLALAKVLRSRNNVKEAEHYEAEAADVAQRGGLRLHRAWLSFEKENR